MIAEKILHNAEIYSDKIALSYFGGRLTYAELKTAVEKRCDTIDYAGQRILITNDNPISSIVELLALQLTGNAVVIVNNELPTNDVDFLKQTVGLHECRIDQNTHKFNDSFFLGVLTSGSTGFPKVIWKDNDCWESAFSHQSELFGISEQDTIFVLDALAYSANLNATLHALWEGASVTFTSLKTANNWSKQLKIDAITSIFLVPSHLKLLESQEINDTISSVVTAGEKLTPALARRIMSVFPNAKVTEYYGAAELGHISFHQGRDIIDNPLSVGKTFPGVSIDIKINQLTIDSPYVSPEYRETGTVQDLGYWEDGKLILIGRAGRMFNRRGLNVYAQEIENKAISFPNVKEARFEEIPFASRSKYTLAYSVENKEQLFNEREFKAYLQAVLPSAKRPDLLANVSELPRLTNGKINVTQLRKIISATSSMDEPKLTNYA